MEKRNKTTLYKIFFIKYFIKNAKIVCICKKGKEIYAIHDAIKQVIAVFCRSNGLYARVEPTNLFRIHDSDKNKRPDIEIIGLPKNCF